MYSPKIEDRYIPILYRVAKAYRVPMTKLVNQIIHDYLTKRLSTDLLEKERSGKNGKPINRRTGM